MGTFYRGIGSSWIHALLVICIACDSTVISQSGFLSIDCGSDESYNDSTGIFWVTDDNYTSTGRNIKNITVTSADPIPNKGQVGTLRYFDDPARSRDCYFLPVVSGATYLVRATFFYGSLGDGSSPTSFSVSLDTTVVYVNEWRKGTNLFESDDFEVIYSAPRSTLDVCLIKTEGWSSFISALELRKLATGMYGTAVGPGLNSYLYTQMRINCGPPEDGSVQFWRYPNDAYDRVWRLFGQNDNATHISNRNLSGSSNSFAENPDRPPNVVMQDAWVYYQQNILWVTVGRFRNPWNVVYNSAFFQDLDSNSSATNVRGMDYYLNDEFIQSFNSSHNPLEVHAILNFTDIFFNMSFVQTNWSLLRPILNAFELYSIYSYNTSTTAGEDVSALHALQIRLNLQEWAGDPCLPYSFDWLSCSDDVFPRITNLSLGNYGFEGSIPIEIVNLTALTYLDLNNNSFNGSIPDLSALVHLQSIYLQHNDLSGEIPSYLGIALPNLTQLDLTYNNFNGTVPSDLIKSALNFTYSNNPNLKNASLPSPSRKSGSRGTSIGAVVGGILGGLVALALVIGIIWMVCTRKRRARSSIIRAIGNAEIRNQGSSSISRCLAGSMTFLTLQEVSDATKMFSKRIGEGSFGPVYYGKLSNGHEVAVKVKSTESRQGATEFLNEVELLSRIHHRNLVSLVGYCEEGNQQIVIYVFVSNGTLRDHLYGDKTRKTLNWTTRLDIALNSARGLEYSAHGL